MTERSRETDARDEVDPRDDDERLARSAGDHFLGPPFPTPVGLKNGLHGLDSVSYAL